MIQGFVDSFILNKASLEQSFKNNPPMVVVPIVILGNKFKK